MRTNSNRPSQEQISRKSHHKFFKKIALTLNKCLSQSKKIWYQKIVFTPNSKQIRAGDLSLRTITANSLYLFNKSYWINKNFFSAIFFGFFLHSQQRFMDISNCIFVLVSKSEISLWHISIWDSEAQNGCDFVYVPLQSFC